MPEKNFIVIDMHMLLILFRQMKITNERIIFLTIMSVINSVVALWEEFMYGKSIKAVQLTDMLPPIFILGHPR